MATPIATSSDEPPTWPPGWLVGVVDETGSTNADLLLAAAHGAPDRTVLAARHQLAGRGRLDRKWQAPPGLNLLVSLLFRGVPSSPHLLTQRVSVAAVMACERVAGIRPKLKWPNDMTIDGRKLAGMLAQIDGDVVVVGIGLNVGWAPAGAARLGRGLEPLKVLRELLVAFDELPEDPWTQYRQNMGTIGERVRVELPTRTISGRALDVDRDGRLLLVDDTAIKHVFDVGDIVHLR